MGFNVSFNETDYSGEETILMDTIQIDIGLSMSNYYSDKCRGLN